MLEEINLRKLRTVPEKQSLDLQHEPPMVFRKSSASISSYWSAWGRLDFQYVAWRFQCKQSPGHWSLYIHACHAIKNMVTVRNKENSHCDSSRAFHWAGHDNGTSTCGSLISVDKITWKLTHPRLLRSKGGFCPTQMSRHLYADVWDYLQLIVMVLTHPPSVVVYHC
jgi:hypothetical protein